jgi:hypothetical protein
MCMSVLYGWLSNRFWSTEMWKLPDNDPSLPSYKEITGYDRPHDDEDDVSGVCIHRSFTTSQSNPSINIMVSDGTGRGLP